MCWNTLERIPAGFVVSPAAPEDFEDQVMDMSERLLPLCLGPCIVLIQSQKLCRPMKKAFSRGLRDFLHMEKGLLLDQVFSMSMLKSWVKCSMRGVSNMRRSIKCVLRAIGKA